MHIVNMNISVIIKFYLFKIQTYVYHIMHSDAHNVLLQSFNICFEEGEENWDMDPQY